MRTEIQYRDLLVKYAVIYGKCHVRKVPLLEKITMFANSCKTNIFVESCWNVQYLTLVLTIVCKIWRFLLKWYEKCMKLHKTLRKVCIVWLDQILRKRSGGSLFSKKIFGALIDFFCRLWTWAVRKKRTFCFSKSFLSILFLTKTVKKKTPNRKQKTYKTLELNVLGTELQATLKF